MEAIMEECVKEAEKLIPAIMISSGSLMGKTSVFEPMDGSPQCQRGWACSGFGMMGNIEMFISFFWRQGVGEFGRYQKFLFVFQAPFAIFVTFVLFGQLFIIRYPDFYWCGVDNTVCHLNTNLRDAQRANLTGPFGNPCLRYLEIDETFLNDARRVCIGGSRPSDCFQWSRRSFGSNGQNVARDEVRRSRRSPQRYRPEWATRTTTSTEKTSSSPVTPDSSTPYPGGREIPGGSELGNAGRQPRPTTTTDRFGRPETTTAAPSTSRNMFCSNDSSSMTCPSPWIIRMNSSSWLNVTALPSRPSCQCRTWDHNRTAFPYRTIVTEAGYWCSILPSLTIEWKLTIAQSMFYVGAIVGGFIIGSIADKYGRVPALIAANLAGFLGGVLTAISTNFWVFCVFRFVSGMAFDNCFVMIYILVLEYVGPSYRTLVANLSIAIFYTFGSLLVPALFELTRNWLVFQLITSIPMLLCLVAYFVVPESARWLLSKGRAKEATDILRKFAKRNGKEVEEKVFVEFQEASEELYAEVANEQEVSLREALKKPRILKNFILLVIIWSIIALIYDGHSRNVLNLGGNVSVMFAIASSTEFPADLLLVFVLDYFGRRWLAFASLGLSALFSMISAVPAITTNANVFLAFAMISRFWVNVAFNIGLQWAAELLPTVIRAQGVNFIHIMGYVASIISPFIASIGRTNLTLSLTILGALSLVGAVLSLFLPETLGEELPNTLEDGETFGARQSFWKCPACSEPEVEDMERASLRPDTEELSKVVRRNNMRGTLRAEAYRSSILCNPRGSRINSQRKQKQETIQLRRARYTR